jgi:hypothetical protein
LLGSINIKYPKTLYRGEHGIHFRSDLLPTYVKQIKSYDDWRTRELSKEGYFYNCADLFISTSAVISYNNMEFLAIEDGYRETDERQ